MTVTVSPIERSNFHIKLTDEDSYEMGLIVAVASPNGEIKRDIKLVSRTPVDRTAIKTSQGDTEYGDFRPPYYALKQDDFSGGRGMDDFSKDRSRFFDSVGVNTRRSGFIHLGGQEQFTTLLRDGIGVQPTNTNWTKLALNATEWATKVTCNATATYDQIWFKAFPTSSISGVKIYDGAVAEFKFDTLLQTAPDSSPPIQPGGWHVLNLTSPLSLTSGDAIWLSVPVSLGDWLPREESITEGSGLGQVNVAGTTEWATVYQGFATRLLVSKEPEFGRLFEYKQALYYIQKVAGAVKLWINGYRGVLSSGTTITATDSTQSWDTNELAVAIFKVVGGTGVNETRRWRRIASNTGTVITFEDAYAAALDNTTEYVILGMNLWTEITGHGLTNIFDVLVGSHGLVYFTQGSTAAMRRMREYNNAGTWTREFAADSTNQASFLTEVGDSIWRVENSNGNASSATAANWGTDLTFGTGIPCGDSTSAFTGLEAYTDDSGASAPMIMKEEIIGFIDAYTYTGSPTFVPLKIKEMASLRSEKNGRAHLVQDTYLYFSLGNGLESYFNPIVKDMGPNRDEGMPTNRQGSCVALSGYPGHFYSGWDGGSEGYSSVLSNAGGWHEEFTGSYGQQMLSLYSQPIPGPDNIDRLWIAYGGDVNWIPIPGETPNPLRDTNYLFTDAGYVETGAYYTELKSAIKYLASIKAVMQEAIFGSSDHKLFIDYKLDDGAWTAIEDSTEGEADGTAWKYTLTSVVNGTPYYGLTGFSVKLRLKFLTMDRTTSPVMLAVVMEGLARIDNKYAYTIPFILEGTEADPAKDLLDLNDDTPAASTKLDKLISWASSGPLYMESVDVRFDDKMVLLLPFVENVVKRMDVDGRVVYLGQLTLQDS